MYAVNTLRTILVDRKLLTLVQARCISKYITMLFSSLNSRHENNKHTQYVRWLGGVVVRVLDSRWVLSGNDLGQVVHTNVSLCSASSIIWYLARAMLTCLYVAAIHGSNEQGE